ncbi:MAG: hypothetical protein RSD14_05705 [Clostridia bacterium]
MGHPKDLSLDFRLNEARARALAKERDEESLKSLFILSLEEVLKELISYKKLGEVNLTLTKKMSLCKGYYPELSMDIKLLNCLIFEEGNLDECIEYAISAYNNIYSKTK